MPNVSVQAQLDRLLSDFVNEEQETIEKCFKKVARDTVKELKQTSPQDKGDYARSWAVKNVKGAGRSIELVVHNKEHYQLTHLLENGHVIRNQFGSYGRVSAKPHIKKAEEKANKELVAELQERL